MQMKLFDQSNLQFDVSVNFCSFVDDHRSEIDPWSAHFTQDERRVLSCEAILFVDARNESTEERELHPHTAAKLW
jgi:hypothetical protein